MRTRALWAQSALAALVGIGVVVQVYLIAAYIFGADALDAHQAVGNVVLALEVLAVGTGLTARSELFGPLGLEPVAVEVDGEGAGPFNRALAPGERALVVELSLER